MSIKNPRAWAAAAALGFALAGPQALGSASAETTDTAGAPGRDAAAPTADSVQPNDRSAARVNRAKQPAATPRAAVVANARSSDAEVPRQPNRATRSAAVRGALTPTRPTPTGPAPTVLREQE